LPFWYIAQFLPNLYEHDCILCADGPAVTNRVDGAAEVLGVHVRRIYELIKILEILSLVTVRSTMYTLTTSDYCPARGYLVGLVRLF
jgi:hypothetical protein